MVSDLAEKGMSGQYAYAYDTQWKEIVDLMDQLRIKKRRVILVMGSESYFRKIICASIVVKANKGISWLSEGAWREGWWKLPDLMLDNYKLYFEEDTNKAEVVEAMADFKSGWNTIAADDPPTDAGRSTALQAYKTEEKEALEYLIADGEYHAHHKKYHGSFRELLVERNYYDLYFFDGKGNMIYSVYKDFDFATNFGSNTNLLAEFSKYQSSGLGEAFRAAQSEPNVIAVSSWAPYGPQASVASFMVKAVRTQDEAALIVGYMGVQLPTSAKSIEDVEPECTLDAITQASRAPSTSLAWASRWTQTWASKFHASKVARSGPSCSSWTMPWSMASTVMSRRRSPSHSTTSRHMLQMARASLPMPCAT